MAYEGIEMYSHVMDALFPLERLADFNPAPLPSS
jgi:hypothetical protein